MCQSSLAATQFAGSWHLAAPTDRAEALVRRGSTGDGAAGANIMPPLTANRSGRERAPGGREVTFCGSGFIADQTGSLLAKAGRADQAALTATVDLAAIAELRASCGPFQDRRPETCGALNPIGGA